MIDTPLFEGELVRLATVDPERDAEALARWSHDPAYTWQSADAPVPARPISRVQARKWLEAARQDRQDRDSRRGFCFAIRTRHDDVLIGLAQLDGIQWTHGSGHLHVHFGDVALWAQPEVTEALNLIRHYVFDELNLYRDETLCCAADTTVIRALEGAGFQIEVRRREAVFRQGQRWDLLHLGALSERDARGDDASEERTTSPIRQTNSQPAVTLNPAKLVPSSLFIGEKVRLAANEPESGAAAFARWSNDTLFHRFDNSDPAYPLLVRPVKDEWERAETKNDEYWFAIHLLVDDRLVGFAGLEITHWSHRDAFLGIGIGERSDWGHGYGTDAMRLLLRYAFTELGLHRVSLNVFEYNPRAQCTYAKVGFVVEGRLRQWLHRAGRRWDLIYMGILRSEWERMQT